MADLIERLRALDTAATPAPWYRLDPPWLPSGSETSILAGSPDPHVATFICDFDFFAFDEEDEKTSECPDADADLIVFLRNNITELADEITALRARVAELEAGLMPFASAAAGVSAFDPDYPMNGAALRASFDWYDKTQNEPLKRHGVRRFDLENARALLAQQGTGHG